MNKIAWTLLLGLVLAGCGKRVLVFPDASGTLATFTDAKEFDFQNPFFQSLGTNGRSCATCHLASDGWSISAASVRRIFAATGGKDPLFVAVDGTNTPACDQSTLEKRREASSLLLERGVIRVGLPVPAEFELVGCDDPHGFASARELSLFRRPLPSTNLRFLTAVMFDGRESRPGQDLRASLSHQAVDATLGHAQAEHPPTPEQVAAIVDFQLGTTTAQIEDEGAGLLFVEGARGSPFPLHEETFFAGINDPLGGNPDGSPFDPTAMRLFDHWAVPRKGPYAEARASVVRGEALFNRRELLVTEVGGLNDLPQVGPVLRATCTVCHDTPNVGNHSLPVPLDIGIAAASRRAPGIPLYTFRNKETGAVLQTTDPGRALVTGRWKDMSRFKGPILRGLAARAPYFHDGSAASLEEVIDFYDARFKAGFSSQDKKDLVAFLRCL